MATGKHENQKEGSEGKRNVMHAESSMGRRLIAAACTSALQPPRPPATLGPSWLYWERRHSEHGSRCWQTTNLESKSEAHQALLRSGIKHLIPLYNQSREDC